MESKKFYYANYDEHDGKLHFTIKETGKFTTKRQALEAYDGYMSYVEHFYPGYDSNNIRKEIERNFRLLGLRAK